MKGWFDAFRADGGPTLYSYSNRTPASDDVSTIFVYLVFATLFVAFVIIFPGIRKERFTTFVSVTLSLFIGLVILLSVCGSDWHVAMTTTSTPYKSFSRDKIVANVGVHIGLNSVNVTLKAPIHVNKTTHIQYNERFFWAEASDIKAGYREALLKGLPFPILTIVEYLSLDGEGFCWGGRYRIAGYFCGILLWASFAVWLLMNILFCVVPRYGAYTMILTGLLLLLTNIVYYANLPMTPMIIPFENGTLRFSFGWCYWLVLATGFICITLGALIAVVDVVFPHKFSTILEVDYDTPYDRHIILQDKCKTVCTSKCGKAANRGAQGGAAQDEQYRGANRDAMTASLAGSKLAASGSDIGGVDTNLAQSTPASKSPLHPYAKDNMAYVEEQDADATIQLASPALLASAIVAPAWRGQVLGLADDASASQRRAHEALHRTQSLRYKNNPNFASFLVLEPDPSRDALKKGRKRPM